MNAIKPEEAYYSEVYLKTNPQVFTEKSVGVLKDFIEYVKNNK